MLMVDLSQLAFTTLSGCLHHENRKVVLCQKTFFVVTLPGLEFWKMPLEGFWVSH